MELQVRGEKGVWKAVVIFEEEHEREGRKSSRDCIVERSGKEGKKEKHIRGQLKRRRRS